MGLIQGVYDAKAEGFLPGGSSLHNMMSPHGPDSDTFLHARDAVLQPHKYENTLAFMFETQRPWRVSTFAMNSPSREKEYTRCWHDLSVLFSE